MPSSAGKRSWRMFSRSSPESQLRYLVVISRFALLISSLATVVFPVCLGPARKTILRVRSLIMTGSTYRLRGFMFPALVFLTLLKNSSDCFTSYFQQHSFRDGGDVPSSVFLIKFRIHKFPADHTGHKKTHPPESLCPHVVGHKR